MTSFLISLFSPPPCSTAIAYLKNAELSQFQENTLTAIVDREGPVKVSFFGAVGLNRVQDPDVVEENGIRVASTIDLVATKLKTVQQRALVKDYVDIASALDTGLSLAEALAAAEAIFGKGFNGALSLKALTYFEDGDLPNLRRDVRDKLREAAASVDLRKLPLVSGKTWHQPGRRAAMSHSDELRKVAKRVVWFKPPEETLNEPTLFLAHVMTYGTLADIITTMNFYSDADFDRVFVIRPLVFLTSDLGTIGTFASATSQFRHCHLETCHPPTFSELALGNRASRRLPPKIPRCTKPSFL